MIDHLIAISKTLTRTLIEKEMKNINEPQQGFDPERNARSLEDYQKTQDTELLDIMEIFNRTMSTLKDRGKSKADNDHQLLYAIQVIDFGVLAS